MRALEDEPRPIGVTLVSPRLPDHTTDARAHYDRDGLPRRLHLCMLKPYSSHTQAMLKRIREEMNRTH